MRVFPEKVRLPTWLCALAVALVSLGATLSLIRHYGSDVPFWDQWEAEGEILLIPAATHSLHVSAFWRHHNEHRIVFTKLINLGLTEANRQWDPLLEMSVNALIHAAIAGLFFYFAARLLRQEALLPVGLVVAAAFSLPFSWENSLAGFQSQFYLLELFAFLSIWAMAGAAPLGRRWWLGFAFAVAGLGAMSSGFVAAACTLALGAGSALLERRRPTTKETVAWLLLVAVCVAGVASVHPVPGHAPLKADGAFEWVHALLHALSWPANHYALTALLVQAPAVALVAGCLRNRRFERDDAVISGLALWTWLQVALLAYGRGHASFIDANRYLDLFAFGVCVNAVAFARLWKPRPILVSVVALLWLGAVLTGFVQAGSSSLAELSTSFAHRRAAERAHVRAEVLHNDPGAIFRAPADELPFPNPAYLVQVLNHPAIRPLLPLSIRAPLTVESNASSHGFSPETKSLLPGAPDSAFWSAAKGPAHFESAPLPANALPVLHFNIAGSRGLSPDCFWLEDQRGHRSHLEIGGFAGDRWQAANLAVPTGGAVRLHAEIPAGAWFAFSRPEESGLYSWYAYTARKYGTALIFLGALLFAAGVVLALRRPAATSPAAAPRLTSGRLVSIAAFAALTAAVCAHLFAFIDRHAVNVLFWDQWDFYWPLFHHEGWWATFTHQHGPHRQGLGFLITRILADASGWNSRWDAFGVGVMLLCALALAFALARRFGVRWGMAMAGLPLAFLTLRQYEEFVGAANLSHGATPLMLIMLSGLAWFIPNRAQRIGALTLVTFVLIFTGFGMFMGVVMPVILCLEAVRTLRAGDTKTTWLLGGAVLAMALTWLLFFHDYLFLAITIDLHPPPHDRLAYLWFVCLMLANLVGVPGQGALSIAAGFAILAALAAVSLKHLARILRDGTEADPRSPVILSFAGFVLVFTFNTALGRTWLGLAEAPEASRYVTLMIPALVALFLEIATWRNERQRLALLVAFALLVAPGALHLRADDRKSVNWYSEGRRRWKQAYLQTGSEEQADKISSFKIYPRPVEGRMRFLKERHLNLFNPDAP